MTSATKAEKSGKKKAKAGRAPVVDAPAGDVGARVDRVIELVAEIEATLGPLVSLGDADRRRSNGRLRDGEAEAIGAVLDAADAYPAFFVALADKDRGKDDAIFESGPTREDLARRAHLARLANVLDPITEGVADTLLALGERVREVSQPAYAIGRIAAASSPKLAAKIAKATKFYATIGAKSARTRKKKSAKAA